MEPSRLPIEKIISGGQTGADEGGLIVGKMLGIPTGGVMPKGFRTEQGPRPEYAELYGVTEHHSDSYVPRTHMNARNGTGTIRIARDFNSPGEKCTLAGIRKAKRPYIDIDISNPLPIDEVRQWLYGYQIKILNVAGHNESRAPGVRNFTIQYLISVLADLSKINQLNLEAFNADKEVLLRNHLGEWVAYSCGLFIGVDETFDELAAKIRPKAHALIPNVATTIFIQQVKAKYGEVSGK